MSEEFESDLKNCGQELEQARNELLGVLSSLEDSDLDLQRRGGWTVGRVLEHVIWSEFMYSRLVNHLRGRPPEGEVPESKPASAAKAVELLATSRRALTDAFEGVDEETFYRIGAIGHEEYSVLSILENEINHEREHAEQIKATVSA